MRAARAPRNSDCCSSLGVEPTAEEPIKWVAAESAAAILRTATVVAARAPVAEAWPRLVAAGNFGARAGSAWPA